MPRRSDCRRRRSGSDSSPIEARKRRATPSTAHRLAETIGGIGSFVGTVLVALTLFLQSRELRLQRHELQLQRREVTLTRAELEKQGAEFRRQGDLMDRERRSRLPRLAVGFGVKFSRSQVPSFAVRITNVGCTRLTDLRVVPLKDGTEVMGHPFRYAVLDPGGETPVLEVDSRSGSTAQSLQMLLAKVDRLDVGVTDDAGSPHRWSVSAARLEEPFIILDELHRPDSGA